MRKLNKDQKILLAMMALIYGAMFSADWSLLAAFVLTLSAFLLSVYLMLRNVRITFGRFTIGRPGTPRSR